MTMTDSDFVEAMIEHCTIPSRVWHAYRETLLCDPRTPHFLKLAGFEPGSRDARTLLVLRGAKVSRSKRDRSVWSPVTQARALRSMCNKRARAGLVS